MHYHVWPRDKVYIYIPYCGELSSYNNAESEYLSDAIKIAQDLTLHGNEWNVYNHWTGQLVWGVNEFDYWAKPSNL